MHHLVLEEDRSSEHQKKLNQEYALFRRSDNFSVLHTYSLERLLSHD